MNIINKKLQLKQTKISKQNLYFLVNRIERTYYMANKISDLLEEKSLEKQSKITRNIINAIIKDCNSLC